MSPPLPTDPPDLTPPVLEHTLAFLRGQGSAPAPQTVVEALLGSEKQAKRTKSRPGYEQLLGTWRLGFITGTVKTRQRAGTVLGAGRFLPRFITIQLRYRATDQAAGIGTVENSVALGALRLQLTGPTQFWPQTHSLAFDFTHITITLGGLRLYRGALRGGETRNAAFREETLKDQAFFTYFWAREAGVAARGRGGGLALWTRVIEKS
ncbi:MAG: hypothetical protein O3A14_09665 [Cyanobacteria bacterium]|nr:hypothetical protein [Cyanobacteriota bacterium]